MNKKRRCLFGVILLMTSSLLSGCWDRIEIEERATILAIAIDPMENTIKQNITGPYAKSDMPGYKITAQVAIPGRIPLGPGGSGSGGSASENPVLVISSTGKTIADTMNALQMQLAERLFFGQLRIIIVNQDLARTGIHDIQDFLHRNAESRRLAWLLISTGSAKDAMEAQPKLERVPTLYLVTSLDQAAKLGRIPNIFLGNYWTTYFSKGQEPVLPLISVQGKDRIQLEGLAVFKGDRMVDTLHGLEVAAYLEFINVKPAGVSFAFPMPGDPAHSIILRSTKRKTKIKLRMENGRPAFDVYTRVEANIEEKTGRKPLEHATFVQLLKTTSEEVKKGQAKVLEKLKQNRADIVGFGEYVRGMQPTYWRKIRSKDEWDQQFAELPIRLHAQVFVRRSGVSTH
jgi:spore germination protein KC